MEIKRFNRKKIATNLVPRFQRSSGKLYLISSILLMVIISIFFYRAGYFNYSVSRVKYFFRGRIKYFIAIYKANPQQINIDIKYKNFQKLAYKRKEAMYRGILFASSQDYVPATIRYKDKSIKVKIRLKGDWARDNLQGEKWSFRVRTKGNNTFLGMKQFSLHHPRIRNYVYEWFFHQALKREKVLSLRYEFVKIILNGKNLGIYALEEHFEKQLIEHNQRREGIILKFDEDIAWRDFSLYREKWVFEVESQFFTNIDAFKTNRILKTPFLYKQFCIAKNLLESFRMGILPTHKVFDIKKLAKYLAISKLTGGIHGTAWHNLRFYYNPITSLLEPVGFDAMAGDGGWDLSSYEKGRNMDLIEKPLRSFYAKIFNDFVFFEEYIKTLKRVSEAAYLDKLLLDIDEELKKNLNIIYSEFPYFNFMKNVFYKKQKNIRASLNPTKGIWAYFNQSFKDHIELELGNIRSMPMEVLNVSYNDSIVLRPVGRIILAPKLWGKLVDYKNVSFKFPENFIWSKEKTGNLVVNYRILGTERIRQQEVFPWLHFNNNFLKNDFIRQKSNIHKFKFLAVNEKNKRIFIKPGIWKINRNLIIPKGYIVIGKEGLQLNLSNSAKILSYSPVKLTGSEEKPIIICSSDSKGQGIIVINSNQGSILKYVVFDNLSNPSQSGWELSGAVTFYNSSVDIQHCRFFNNNSEDALNLIHSVFTIDKTLFSNVSFDALDVDFSKGEIENCSFVSCGNDAIDFSGSIIEMQNVFVRGAGDKALSVGENSMVSAEKIDIKNAKIAVASKDISTTIIKEIRVSDCEIGLAVYQKKSEFGPGFMNVSKLKTDKVGIPYLVEDKSELKINGKVIKSNKVNVSQILSGIGNVKKSSK